MESDQIFDWSASCFWDSQTCKKWGHVLPDKIWFVLPPHAGGLYNRLAPVVSLFLLAYLLYSGQAPKPRLKILINCLEKILLMFIATAHHDSPNQCDFGFQPFIRTTAKSDDRFFSSCEKKALSAWKKIWSKALHLWSNKWKFERLPRFFAVNAS